MGFTLTPAYGRDYKSKKAVIADFNADKDFVDSSFDAKHTYINKQSVVDAGGGSVKLRYNANRQEVTVTVDG